MNLAGSTPGATYTAVMTASAINPVGGTIYRVEWGNAVGTNLFLGNGIVGIGTSTTVHTAMTSEATVQRSVVFGDEAGRVMMASNRQVVLGSNFVRAAATYANVTGMVLTLPVGTWAIFFAGEVRSSDTDGSVLLQLVGSSATILGGTLQLDTEDSFGANENMGRTGMVLASVGSGTGTVQLQVSSQPTRTATVMAGAVLCAIRIA